MEFTFVCVRERERQKIKINIWEIYTMLDNINI